MDELRKVAQTFRINIDDGNSGYTIDRRI